MLLFDPLSVTSQRLPLISRDLSMELEHYITVCNEKKGKGIIQGRRHASAARIVTVLPHLRP
jgi:hypothetical protein